MLKAKVLKIRPDKWYIVNLIDPKRPSISKTYWVIRELCERDRDWYFPFQPMVEVMLGSKILESKIKPKASKYGPARFSVVKYPWLKGLTRQERITLLSPLYRRLRRAKFKAAKGFKPGEYIKWGDLLPKNFKDENGKTVRNPERYRMRHRMIRAMNSHYDHL